MKKILAKSRRLCRTSGARGRNLPKTAKELTGLFSRWRSMHRTRCCRARSGAEKHGGRAAGPAGHDVPRQDQRHAGGPSRTSGIFLVRRLSEAWRLLLEIRRALPYRWIGEAARVEGARPPKIANLDRETDRILKAFMDTLPNVRKLLVADVQAAYDGDPAALTFAEVLLSYPGLLAIAAHRLAHELYRLNVPIIPRIMSEWIHTKTGTDIHPGARIGRAFFIDHATGVVIGETTEIGDHVKLYQGVTLGARSFALGAAGHPVKHIKRHPTVKDNVIIYANATVLGGETVIGARSIIGSNVFLMESVPPDSVVSSNHPELSIRGKKRIKKT